MRHSTAKLPGLVSLAKTSRVDDFVLVTAPTTIADFCHVGSHVAVLGSNRVTLGPFSGISAGCKLFTSNDAYDGSGLMGPMVPYHLRNVHHGPITLEPFVQLGANSVVLPGVTIGEGTCVGAGSLVKSSLAPWGVYAGNPLRLVKPRSRDVMLRNTRMVWSHYGDWQREHSHMSWTQYLDAIHAGSVAMKE